MEAASPPLTFPVSAVQATGPPLRPQGSLPRSLRDGSCGPPLTPEPLRPLTAQWQGAGTKPLPAGPHGAHDQAQQNKVSTVSGDCHRNFRDLLDHLATLTRDRIRYHNNALESDKLTAATPPPAPRLRTHRRPHPTDHRRVARTTTHQNQQIPRSNQEFAYFNSLNFGLARQGIHAGAVSGRAAWPPPAVLDRPARRWHSPDR